ncbi:hypothetical protein K432DRAFT_400314 [Lepidopterella palustris CBS 459.81]|uniref:Uncharacterized protein n=1 Tax=Lepidopterella palustris CBS 459.81 TaxID=1314670 RepID=A0A8E2EK44_9PEZI|nr:hypothetical protein K432DRAFT_400314 [Lepidopterella palustris CBS 459.81]
MVKTTIKCLFTESEEHYKTQAWYEELRKDESAYQDCFITTFTRVKNLASDYKHEYVQFIVEDRKSGDRARVYAERANEDIVDYVTVGRTEVGFKKWPELPLPLTSLVFPKEKQPKVMEIAKILSSITVVGGGYNYYDHNCFWFANTAYKVVKAAFKATEKKWSWINTGGAGGGSVGDAWGLGFPTLFKFAFKTTAEKFKAERETKTEYLQPGFVREDVTPEEIVSGVITELLQDGHLEEYVEAMRLNGVDVDQAKVEMTAESVKESAAKLSQQDDISWTQDFDNDVEDFCAKTLADPAAEDLRKAFQATQLANTEKTPDGEIILEAPEEYFGPGQSEFLKMQKAMEVLAGKVLVETRYAKN